MNKCRIILVTPGYGEDLAGVLGHGALASDHGAGALAGRSALASHLALVLAVRSLAVSHSSFKKQMRILGRIK